MGPSLIINPSADEEFGRVARMAVDLAAGDIRAAELGLRERYPNALIRARDISGETIVVWYVYREGLWVSG